MALPDTQRHKIRTSTNHGCRKPNRSLYLPDRLTTLAGSGTLVYRSATPSDRVVYLIYTPLPAPISSLTLPMPGLASGDNDSPVRVVVTPSQPSYFAGEPFAVTVTFTNTRSPEAGPSKPSAHAHKRGAHSISSAPLARPPTSPGTPRSAIAQSLLKTQTLADAPRRKGLIGKKKPPPLPLQSVGQLPDLIEQRRRRQLAPKALSVSLSPHELEDAVGEGVIGSSALYTQRSFFRDALHSEL